MCSKTKIQDGDEKCACGDSFISKRVPGYLARCHSDAFTISAHLEQGNFKLIQLLGHRLEGSAGIYELQGLSQIGQRLEHAAKRQAADEIAELLDSMFTFLERERFG